jgi:hypothetical protein
VEVTAVAEVRVVLPQLQRALPLLCGGFELAVALQQRCRTLSV